MSTGNFDLRIKFSAIKKEKIKKVKSLKILFFYKY